MSDWCPQCGGGVKCDADGLCCICGATLITREVFGLIVKHVREQERIKADVKRKRASVAKGE